MSLRSSYLLQPPSKLQRYLQVNNPTSTLIEHRQKLFAMATSSIAESNSNTGPLYVFGTADQLLNVVTGNEPRITHASTLCQCKRIQPLQSDAPSTLLSLREDNAAYTCGKLYRAVDLKAGIKGQPQQSATGPAQVRSPAGYYWQFCSSVLHLPSNTASFTIVTGSGPAATTKVYNIENGSGSSDVRIKVGKFCKIPKGVHTKPDRTDQPLFAQISIPGPFTLVLPVGKKLSAPSKVPTISINSF